MIIFGVIISLLLYVFIASWTWQFCMYVWKNEDTAMGSSVFWPIAWVVFSVILIIKLPAIIVKHYRNKNLGPKIIIEKGAQITSDSQYQTLYTLINKWECDTKRRKV